MIVSAALFIASAYLTPVEVKSLVVEAIRDVGINWGEAEADIMVWLAKKESGFFYLAKNKRSSAFGLFQFIKQTRINYGLENSLCPKCQTVAALKYVDDRYGDPHKMRTFWQVNKFY